MVKSYITFFLFLLFKISFGQTALLDEVDELHEVGAYAKAKPVLVKIDTTGFNKVQQGNYLYHLALSKINIDGKLVEAYQVLLDAKKLIQQNDLYSLYDVNDELIYTQLALGTMKQSSIDELIEENCTISIETNDPEFIIGCNGYKLRQIDDDEPEAFERQLDLLHKSRSIAQKNDFKVIYGNNQLNIAAIHNDAGNLDSALIYYERAREYVENKKYVPTKIGYYLNLGFTYYELEDYNNAIRNYQTALNLSNEEATLNYKSNILLNMLFAYEKAGNYEEAFATYRLLDKHKDSLNGTEKFKSIQELEAKYQVQERKLENAELSADNERQKVMIISIAGSMLVLLLGGLFVYKNQDKKRRLALQEKELQKQRADNLMKNQELATIDAMISGQEKERKKIAQDLHDDLGSSLTTIRLYFENLKDHFKEGTSIDIYQRTDKLLEDTYRRIREMSHNRHNGVLASEGLIPSLETLGKTLTNSGKLNVEIYNHGMDRKLENSLELNIFRMLQELLSNVVKHAGAQTATINLIGSDTSINLMIEDDGNGFILDTNKKSDGMGLYSIEKRVEEMDGTFEVDTSPGNGTTISIEIPIL